MTAVRPPAVAGAFYPGDAKELDRMVRGLLAGAARGIPAAMRPPKAIIAPHAGFVFSGPVAANAYARLAPLRESVRRVVLIGPSHRVPLRGLAVSTAEAFATPLGAVPADREATRAALELPQVAQLDEPHAHEHSLEVHLPFLQALFEDFTVAPLVAGQASGERVAEVLERLWGGPETVIVISSDLSHYLDYDTARRVDAATTQAIERLRPQDIGFEQACGRVPIIGLLTLAQRRGLACTTIDLRSSGDTAGPRDRVVGYGAYLFGEGGPDEDLRERHGETLLDVAAGSITHGLAHGEPLPVDKAGFAAELRDPRACFVTLKIGDKLRGCVGSPRAWRPLVEDVSDNAFRAAFKDPRFQPLTEEERERLDLSLSVLTSPVEIAFGCEAELLGQLRPGLDGVILEDGDRRGLFLPGVWESLPEPKNFLGQLKRKAGLPPDHWSDTVKAYRFAALSISPSGPKPVQ